MFNSSLITENKYTFFCYINAKGQVSKQIITNTIEKDNHFQGYSLVDRGFRIFRKDRVLAMYSSEEELNEATLPESAPIPTKPITQKKNTGLEICFTGFLQADKSRLKTIAEEKSMTIRDDVSANLYFLCVGDNKGWRKIEKAVAKNAFIITESQFLHFIETGEIPYEAPDLENLAKEKITPKLDDLQQMVEKLSLNFRTIREPRRSAALIANFVDGYAAGWTFAVKDAFKSALDIKQTKITFEGITYSAWTQGSSYQFQRGDTFYSHKLGYDSWKDFLLLHNATVLQIKYDCYSGYETIASFEGVMSGAFNPNRLITPKTLESVPILMESQTYDPGTIIVEVFIPNESKNGLKSLYEITITQDDLILLLQSGCYWQKQSGQQPKYVNVLNHDRT